MDTFDFSDSKVPSSGDDKPNYITDHRFTELLGARLISEETCRALTQDMKLEFMTQVQAATLQDILSGYDVLAQARTGTGKTLAFLIPAVQRLLNSNPPVQRPASGNGGQAVSPVSILVLSPTRELALQISSQAELLLTHLPFKVQTVVGGTNMSAEAKRLVRQRCDILVATPGRLIDHFTNSNLVPACSRLQLLVLDEADRLLDQGFKKDLEKIFSFLPPRDGVASGVSSRQTLLFSATVSTEVKQIAALALRPGYKFISTVPADEVNTHEHVPQHHVIVNFNDIMPVTLALIHDEMMRNPKSCKILLFFPTARGTQMAAEIFRLLGDRLKLPVFEIHSRKSQAARIKASSSFRDCTAGLLLSSDVSARGMDFPNVTAVYQVGLPSSAEQYVHRLGRTARGTTTTGSGVLVLCKFEGEVYLHGSYLCILYLTRAPPGVDMQHIHAYLTCLRGADSYLHLIVR